MGRVEPGPRDEVEECLAGLCAQGDYGGAATKAIRAYGPEIVGFLRACAGGADDPSETFSDFTEALWKGLPSFAWRSSVRTWAYGIARNVSRSRGRERARRRRLIVDPGESVVQGVAEQVRTETLSFLRTEKRTRLQALRDALPEDDRMLLVLRVDRGLAWNELARVFSGDEGPLDGAALVKEAARLRKRLQLVKQRLKEMARREGLL
jgi:RNA polymerase sigma-70 factor (ECF subfamily)